MDKNLKKETLYLYLIQISNFIIPLIAFPYLAFKLGVEGFGKLGFAQTIYFLFVFLVDFGFNLTGAKSISNNRDSKNALNSIYSNIQLVKFVLFVSLCIMSFPFFLWNGLSNIDSKLVLLALISSFSSFLIPNYVFNGLGRNSILAFITVLIKSLFLIPIFFFVNGFQDIVIAALFQIIPGVVIGLIIQYILYVKDYVRFDFKLLEKKIYTFEAKSSFDNFIASFFTLGFTYFTPILIKYTLGDVALGLYTVVDRLITAFKQLYTPITQAFFSKICIAYEEQRNIYYLLLKKVSLIFVIIGTGAFLGNLALGNILLPLIFGTQYDVYYYLLIAILIQIVVSFASIMVNFVIIPSNNSFILKKIYFLASIVYFPLCWLLLLKMQLSGVFLSMLIIELCVLLSMYIFLKNISFRFK